jgi:hypothetical protein
LWNCFFINISNNDIKMKKKFETWEV